MMWWNGSGWGWFWMSFSMIVFWGLVAFGIVWLVRSTRTPTEHRHDAEDILAERFAHGDLSAEEYEERKKVLAKR